MQSPSAFLCTHEDVNTPHPCSKLLVHSFLITPPYGLLSLFICRCLLKRCFKTHCNHICRVLGVYFPSIWITILQIKKTEWACLRRKEVGAEPSWFPSVCKQRLCWKCLWGKILNLRKDKRIDAYSLEEACRMTWRNWRPLSYIVFDFKVETDYLSWRNPGSSYHFAPCQPLCTLADYSWWHIFSFHD